MAPKRTLIMQMTVLVAMLGLAAWLYATVAALSEEITCIIDGIKDLDSIDKDTHAGEVAGEAAAAVPTELLDVLETYVPLIGAVAILPAAFLLLINLLIVYNTAKTKAGQGACCTKCLMCLNMLLLIVGIAFYAVVGIVGIAVTTPDGEEGKELFKEVCDDFVPQLDDALEEAAIEVQYQYDRMEYQYGSDMDSSMYSADYQLALTELAASQEAVNYIAEMCVCLLDIFDVLATFTAPGIGCSLCCIFLFFLNCCACCCIGRGKKANAAKAPPNPGTEMVPDVIA